MHTGNYIISGGNESVMVQWQLDTGRKQFLPHLSSPICNIVVSPSGNSYAIKLADNSVMVLSARELLARATLTGLQASSKETWSWDRHDQATCQRVGVAAVLHPKQPDRLLIAVPARQQNGGDMRKAAISPVLQTYDIRTDCHISRQALTRTNTTTLTVNPEGGEITAPDIQYLDVSNCGKWLATVDAWRPNPDDLRSLEPNSTSGEIDHFQEVYLKFWGWNSTSGLWELVTRIDAPHFSERGPVTVLGLSAQPHGKGFATIGRDAVLRLWYPITRQRSGAKAADAHQRLETWRCQSSIDLKGCTGGIDAGGLEAACMAFSEDGSVLAICLQAHSIPAQSITLLVDIQAGQPCHSRSGLFSGVPHAVRFLGKCLIIASDSSLSIWDTVDDSVRAVGSSELDIDISVERSLKLLAVDCKARTFAVAAQNSPDHTGKRRRRSRFHVQVRSLDSLALVYDAALRNPPVSLLLDSFSGNYIVVDTAASVRRIGHLDDKNSKATAQYRELSVNVSLGLAGLLGSHSGYAGHASRLGMEEAEDTAQPHKQLATIFDGAPSYSLPSVSVLFRDVVKSLV